MDRHVPANCGQAQAMQLSMGLRVDDFERQSSAAKEKNMRLIQGLIAAGLFATLVACNTIGGAGQDLQSGGQAITDTANDAERSM
jgi:entericidin B